MQVKFFSWGELYLDRLEQDMNTFLSSEVAEVVDKNVFFDGKRWNIVIFYIKK